MDNNIKNNSVRFLFRRGKKEHIENLFYNGELYINTIDFIRKCDDNEERSDKDDGISYRNYLGTTSITICDIGKDFDKDGFKFTAQNTILQQDQNIRKYILHGRNLY